MEWPNDAVRLSYPDWIVDATAAPSSATTPSAAMARMNEPAPVSVRDDGYRQDLASQWVAAAVEAAPGERILDLCAAPGGKATAMAANGAYVSRADLQMHRADSIQRRAGASSATRSRRHFAPGSFDKVLIDAPCSGLGALRRRADARWRITEARRRTSWRRCSGASSPAAAPLVRPGGWLVYSVCTLTAEESIDHPMPDGFESIAEAPAPDVATVRARLAGPAARP